jgi:hypothetical protein
MPTGKHYFIEAAEAGGYRVIAKGAKKASTVTGTQKEAIAAVKQFNPQDRPDVSRARVTATGKPDQWRAARTR